MITASGSCSRLPARAEAAYISMQLTALRAIGEPYREFISTRKRLIPFVY